jgi:formate hydrogenlyase subunit 3/multisubunit Na+/H+ antiporter MnhD subunit
MAISATLWSIAALLGTGVLAIAIQRSRLASRATYGCALAASLVILGFACIELTQAALPPPSATLPIGLPWIGARFRIDALTAFFQIVVNLGAAAASLYALGYGEHEKAPGRVLPFYPVFLGGMNLVLIADDAFSFLVAWEFMSLSSWALVLSHHRDRDNTRAGYVYLLMASFGTLSLLLAFGLLAGSGGGYGFSEIRSNAPAAWTPDLVLVLAVIGTGSKAGLVPLHIWLPLAHPAAPSHVSALMSGVMTKVAVYGFVRIVFDLLGPPTWWWSILVLALAGITAVLGVLSALMQHDMKRLLAYHTVENIGIIFIGLGLALAFAAYGMKAPAALAFTAALLHVLNHMLFKSLLFFGAGAVLNATGERDMEHLGGLIHPMPFTAFAFLVGCAAISALPPLNGFVSEWLTFQAILLSPMLPPWGLKLAVPAVGAALALSAALAAYCFVKAFGVTFLSRPRSEAARGARETDRASLWAMGLLALLCLMIGLLPGYVIDAIGPVSAALIDERMPQQSAIAWASIVPITESRGSYNGLLVFVFITVSTLLVVEVIHRFASRAVRRAPAWDCGHPDPNPATQYTADSFAQPVRRVLGNVVFRAREVVSMPPPGDSRPARIEVRLKDLVWDWFYAPVSGGILYLAEKLNHLQFLTIRRYLSLVFGALVILLLMVAVSA